jgi:hypothetical protein
MEKPQFSSDIIFVPVSFNDRDNLVGRIMEVIEAVMPETKQQEATKSLIKQRLSEYFVHLYNDAFTALKDESPTVGSTWDDAVRALWEVQPQKDAQTQQKIK